MQRLIMPMRTVALTLAVLFSTSAFADFDTGVAAYERGDYAAAYNEFKPLAEQGHARAQNNLGVMYEQGRGVPRDDQEAVKWYRKAADQGDADAQYSLGVMYAQGRGVSQDYQEAVNWYRKAAEQGDAAAQYNLGVMYAQGQGVPQDDQEAVKWYRKAAEQGDADAQNNLGMMDAQGLGVPQSNLELALVRLIILLSIIVLLFMRPKFIRDCLGDRAPTVLGFVALVAIALQFLFYFFLK